MPHYKDGTGAKVGDKVTIEFDVTSVYEGETACNASLVAEPPEGESPLYVTTNTRFCTLVNEPVEPDADPSIEG